MSTKTEPNAPAPAPERSAREKLIRDKIRAGLTRQQAIAAVSDQEREDAPPAPGKPLTGEDLIRQKMRAGLTREQALGVIADQERADAKR